ncbi:MAG: hypothetical protein WEA09_11275 [Gemmatimonadota bacterium]
MLELIAFGLAGAGAIFGHIQARNFTYTRLRWTRVSEHPGVSGMVAAAGTVILAAPVLGLLPIVGAGTALALGAGVGTGVTRGARGVYAP